MCVRGFQFQIQFQIQIRCGVIKAFNYLVSVRPFMNFVHHFSQARNYINSLQHMPKRNFADVFIGANPLGKFPFHYQVLAYTTPGLLSPSSGIICIIYAFWPKPWGKNYISMDFSSVYVHAHFLQTDQEALTWSHTDGKSLAGQFCCVILHHQDLCGEITFRWLAAGYAALNALNTFNTLIVSTTDVTRLQRDSVSWIGVWRFWNRDWHHNTNVHNLVMWYGFGETLHT